MTGAEGALRGLSLNQATVKHLSLEQAVGLCLRHEIPAIGLWRDRVAERGLAPAAAAEQARLLASNARYLIATAARAPSIHNSQPWRFRVDADAVELWADPARRTRDDAIGREMLISCGAALFGLRLAVRSLGHVPVTDLLPDPSQLRLLARVRVLGVPSVYLAQGKPDSILAKLGLDADGIADEALAWARSSTEQTQ